MNSLMRGVKIGVLIRKNGSPLVTAVRNHWNKDFQPGPYPATQEARIAAAKKYGIPVKEYEPYPDDGTGSGDYPKLPAIGAESKDPFYPWDQPELKKNYTETMHEDFDLLTEDRYDPTRRFHQPMWVLWAQFLGVMSVLWILHQYISEKSKMFLPVIPPEYPKPGKVHYTFEKC